MTKDILDTIQLSCGAKLSNRIFMAPMTIQAAYFDGSVTSEMIDYYQFRSGDASAIIVESCFVEEHGRGFPGAIGIDNDDKIPGLKRLAQAIKNKGSKAILQIYHAGRMANPKLNSGETPISASPVAALRPDAVVPREMSQNQIESMIEQFGLATRRAIEAGFDGVEIHGANTYLLQQFFSAHSNRRQDDWGGDNAKRATFPIKVLQRVQQEVKTQQAKEFIIGYRFSPEEIEEPGIRFEDTMFLLNTLAEYQPDYFHISSNSYKRTSIVNQDDQEPLIKKYRRLQSDTLANIPLIGVGSIAQYEDAKDALRLGYDLLSIGKAYLVEPQWLTKIMKHEKVEEFVDIHDQQPLHIPAPLWKVMDFMILDKEEEHRKYEKLKALQNKKVKFKAGVYHVFAKGHNGDLPMKVELSDNKIISIDIDDSGESEGIANPVFERLPRDIVDNQTLNIDAISGATVTSQGILDGVAHAIIQSGENPDILRARPKPVIQWSNEVTEETTDIVVIGSGGAGLSAAATALDLHKDIVLLEKFPAIGGNTIRTGGQVNAPEPDWQNSFPALAGEKDTLSTLLNMADNDIDSDYQEDFRTLKNQIQEYLSKTTNNKDYLFDSIELHRIQTYLGGKRTDKNGKTIIGRYDLVKTLTDRVLESVNWLTDKGVHFDRSFVDMPVGALWRRGHKPMKSQGLEYVETLSDYIKSNNGRIMTETTAEKLIINDHKVIGVEARKSNGAKVKLYARHGVILATGGFGANTKMLQQYNTYWNHIPDDIKTTNSPAITGDGIRLGAQAGADLVGMGFTQFMPISDPKTGALFTGLIVTPSNFVFVNKKGERFVNEFESRDVLSKAALEQKDGIFYIIADENIKSLAMNTSEEKIQHELEDGTLVKADTLEALAQKLNIDSHTFIKTIKRYNHFVEQGYDDDFHKNAFDLKIEKPPFYATPRKPAVHHTMGGLSINTHAQVLDINEQVIPGLYASGEVTGGIHAGNRLGGNALADIFTFGRIAAQTASQIKVIEE
ncbi:flavocytochrome c [Staphylococcus felis]|uniref:Urocanate reductase n=1 Tax=Staphylococcus felis TaxID=46127 RepID=A0A3E0IM42_9STAP|nr:NADH-dependent flavin oxidoreductase [Staphylococcus felis]REH77204.1 flavocytochrome c [Staphylococcus felis]REH83914.1 flavocytochrome c [Staphylococcus felis]REH90738.1 flavocytochrome c [Staphylococcus felis]REH91734.1 flavocytochrome c [Staphylococcus felis]REH96321.1 flavocytochrome c [Staphylococcus felis]